MAVATEISTVTYQGNASTSTIYPVPFEKLSVDHVNVWTRAPGASWMKLARSAWVWATSGVRTVAAVPVTHQLQVERSTPILQPNRYVVGGVFPAFAHERALDRLTMAVQERTFPNWSYANRPRVAGSRGNNPALSSLITGLANAGIIINTTTP